jgi:hypothetical protein
MGTKRGDAAAYFHFFALMLPEGNTHKGDTFLLSATILYAAMMMSS